MTRSAAEIKGRIRRDEERIRRDSDGWAHLLELILEELLDDARGRVKLPAGDAVREASARDHLNKQQEQQ